MDVMGTSGSSQTMSPKEKAKQDRSNGNASADPEGAKLPPKRGESSLSDMYTPLNDDAKNGGSLDAAGASKGGIFDSLENGSSAEAAPPQGIFDSKEFVSFLENNKDEFKSLALVTKDGTVLGANFGHKPGSMGVSGVFKSTDQMELMGFLNASTSQSGDSTSRPSGPSSGPGNSGTFTSKDWMANYQPTHKEVEISERIFNSDGNSGDVKAQTNEQGRDWLKDFQQALMPKDSGATGKNKLSAALMEAVAQAAPADTSNGSVLEKRKSGAKKPRKVIPEVKEYVDEYKEEDVLFGRGGLSNHHSGNKYYRALVLSTQTDYQQSEKADKTTIAQKLVDKIRTRGGRFLELDKAANRWYVVENITARRKVGQALREDNSSEARAMKRAKYGYSTSKSKKSKIQPQADNSTAVR